MKNGRWARTGRASLPTWIVCTCDGVGLPCLVCETLRETELGCDDRLDGTRQMPAPVRTPEDDALQSRIVRRWAAAAIAVWLLVAGLLKLCGARTLTP